MPAVLAVAPSVISHGTKQYVSSFSTGEAVLPVGQVSHEASIENGFVSGLDIYLPLGQQPSRPLLLSKTSVKVDHLPPHNVRLKPLLENMVSIVVTLSVVHLDKSLLNAEAPRNAVGAKYSC